MIDIIPIPAFHDNYIWLLMHPQCQYCAVVDPGDATPVLDFLKANQLTLSAILITHHHSDHTAGIKGLLKHYQVPVFGPAKEHIPSISAPLSEGAQIYLDALNIHFQILDIPGHTAGHIAYYGEGLLFCGDTLFSGGCGRLFEGTPRQMLDSLSKLAALPDNTQVYCAHEYTADNLQFALTIEPANRALLERIEDVAQKTKQKEPTLPSTMAIERATNPFLRTHSADVAQAAKQHSGEKLATAVDIFATLRTWKDHWRGITMW